MPLGGRVRLKSDSKIEDFDYYKWWRALIDKGLSPTEAWQLDFIESSHLLELTPIQDDATFALYYQRKSNGASDEWQRPNQSR